MLGIDNAHRKMSGSTNAPTVTTYLPAINQYDATKIISVGKSSLTSTCRYDAFMERITLNKSSGDDSGIEETPLQGDTGVRVHFSGHGYQLRTDLIGNTAMLFGPSTSKLIFRTTGIGTCGHRFCNDGTGLLLRVPQDSGATTKNECSCSKGVYTCEHCHGCTKHGCGCPVVHAGYIHVDVKTGTEHQYAVEGTPLLADLSDDMCWVLTESKGSKHIHVFYKKTRVKEVYQLERGLDVLGMVAKGTTCTLMYNTSKGMILQQKIQYYQQKLVLGDIETKLKVADINIVVLGDGVMAIYVTTKSKVGVIVTAKMTGMNRTGSAALDLEPQLDRVNFDVMKWYSPTLDTKTNTVHLPYLWRKTGGELALYGSIEVVLDTPTKMTRQGVPIPMSESVGAIPAMVLTGLQTLKSEHPTIMYDSKIIHNLHTELMLMASLATAARRANIKGEDESSVKAMAELYHQEKRRAENTAADAEKRAIVFETSLQKAKRALDAEMSSSKELTLTIGRLRDLLEEQKGRIKSLESGKDLATEKKTRHALEEEVQQLRATQTSIKAELEMTRQRETSIAAAKTQASEAKREVREVMNELEQTNARARAASKILERELIEARNETTKAKEEAVANMEALKAAHVFNQERYKKKQEKKVAKQRAITADLESLNTALTTQVDELTAKVTELESRPIPVPVPVLVDNSDIGVIESKIQAEVEKRVRAEVTVEVEKRVRAEVTAEVEKRVRAEATAEAEKRVRAEVTAEVEKRVRAEVTAEMEKSVRAEVTAEMEKRVRAEVTTEMEKRVRAEVTTEMEKRVRAEVTTEMEKRVREEMTANMDKRVSESMVATLPPGGDLERVTRHRNELMELNGQKESRIAELSRMVMDLQSELIDVLKSNTQQIAMMQSMYYQPYQ